MMFETYSDCKHVADFHELSRPTYFPLIYADTGALCQHNVNIVCDFLASGIDHKYNNVLHNSLWFLIPPSFFPAGGLSKASWQIVEQQQQR